MWWDAERRRFAVGRLLQNSELTILIIVGNAFSNELRVSQLVIRQSSWTQLPVSNNRLNGQMDSIPASVSDIDNYFPVLEALARDIKLVTETFALTIISCPSAIRLQRRWSVLMRAKWSSIRISCRIAFGGNQLQKSGQPFRWTAELMDFTVSVTNNSLSGLGTSVYVHL